MSGVRGGGGAQQAEPGSRAAMQLRRQVGGRAILADSQGQGAAAAQPPEAHHRGASHTWLTQLTHPGPFSCPLLGHDKQIDST